MKEKTMIEVYKDDVKDLIVFKYKTNSKNMPETISFIIDKLKEQEELYGK